MARTSSAIHWSDRIDLYAASTLCGQAIRTAMPAVGRASHTPTGLVVGSAEDENPGLESLYVEEHFCFVLLHMRWKDDETYRAATQVALVGMPAALRTLVRPIIRARILRDLWGQGLGRHSHDEVVSLGRDDLDALASQLGADPFVMGDQPSSVDATAYAFLAVLLLVPLENELKTYAVSLENVAAYCERIQRQYFAARFSGS